nr:MDIS1-interacting receptor like kinase 2-like [Ipomoea batatas]
MPPPWFCRSTLVSWTRGRAIDDGNSYLQIGEFGELQYYLPLNKTITLNGNVFLSRLGTAESYVLGIGDQILCSQPEFEIFPSKYGLCRKSQFLGSARFSGELQPSNSCSVLALSGAFDSELESCSLGQVPSCFEELLNRLELGLNGNSFSGKISEAFGVHQS